MAAVELHDAVCTLRLFVELGRKDDGAPVGAQGRDVLPQLEKGAAPAHAYLGVSTGAAQNGEGAQVGDATAGGPAAEAGVQPGDVITEVDGDEVRGPEDVAQAIEDDKPGDRVELKVQRGGSEQTVQVTLGQRPEQLPSTGTP